MSAPRFYMGKPKSTPSSSSTVSLSRPSTSSSKPSTSTLDPNDEDLNLPEYRSEKDICPVCKTDRFLNPKLRLLVSSCYHRICESCIDRLFSLGPEPCPICGVTIRKAHFQKQVYENLAVQRELTIRRRMARIYNKREEDFTSTKAYNLYLQEVEDLTFSLLNEKDVEKVESLLARYKAENQDSIDANLEKAEMEKEKLREREESERREKEEMRREYERLDELERQEKEEDKKKVLEALASSEKDAEQVVKMVRSSALKRSTARLNSQPVLSSSLRSLNGLKSLDPSTVQEEDSHDILSDLSNWDSYSNLYEIKGKHLRSGGYDENVGLGSEKKAGDVGGFVAEQVWEKVIRSAVAGLWLRPIEEDDDDDVDVDMN